MRSKLHYTILGGCVAALLIVSLSGCATTSSPTPPANLLIWKWSDCFDTGDSCRNSTVEIPISGKVSLSIKGSNNWWGNVPKMWIYLNGKQVAYDVGRMEDATWEGKVDKGDKVKFRACAETHGDSARVGCNAEFIPY